MDNKLESKSAESAFHHKPPDIMPKFSVYEPINLSVDERCRD
jgi:hypothetical protein